MIRTHFWTGVQALMASWALVIGIRDRSVLLKTVGVAALVCMIVGAIIYARPVIEIRQRPTTTTTTPEAHV